jgi:hypothetical protein
MLYRSTMKPVSKNYSRTVNSTIMKNLIAFPVALGLAISSHALPLYDNFTTYGAPGTWTEVSGPPIVSYTTGAPLVGGNTAPSGESWIVYTNAPAADLYVNYYAGDFTGYDSQNVAVVNYFGAGQPGVSDSVSSLTLPAGFPGPFVTGHDTRTNSLWTPGWSQTGETSPPLGEYLGGVGACLKFASDITGTSGNKVFTSFYVDVPDTTGSFGSGQSLDHGYSAGFLPLSEIPSPNSTAGQNALPGYSAAGYTSCPLFEKLNVRATATSAASPFLGWRPGVGDTDANAFSVGGGPYHPQSIHFIVLSYEFNGGSGADEERVWIDPQASVFAASTEPLSGLGAGSLVSHLATSGDALTDVGGFFFLANTQDGGATPNSGILFNSLSIGTNWAYVTGGLQTTTAESVTTVTNATVVLNPPLAAGGGVTTISSAAWANSSGPLSGPRYSVNATTGALTITGVLASDADTYSVTATTPIASENSVAAVTALNTVPLTVITSESANPTSTQFTLNFYGPTGVGYRIWSTTSFNLLGNPPVIGSPGWTLVTSGTYVSGPNSYTDTAATGQTKYYTITVP